MGVPGEFKGVLGSRHPLISSPVSINAFSLFSMYWGTVCVLLFQSDDLAEEVVQLKNQLAELEDEKGNLQLKLVDYEEAQTMQGDSPATQDTPQQMLTTAQSLYCNP